MRLTMREHRAQLALLALLTVGTSKHALSEQLADVSAPKPGDDRIIFQTEFGDIEMALYPDVWPLLSKFALVIVQACHTIRGSVLFVQCRLLQLLQRTY